MKEACQLELRIPLHPIFLSRELSNVATQQSVALITCVRVCVSVLAQAEGRAQARSETDQVRDDLVVADLHYLMQRANAHAQLQHLVKHRRSFVGYICERYELLVLKKDRTKRKLCARVVCARCARACIAMCAMAGRFAQIHDIGGTHASDISEEFILCIPEHHVGSLV